jgi:hypothetical protein
MRFPAAVGLVLSLVACKSTARVADGLPKDSAGLERPRVEIKYQSCQWDGEGPNAAARCRFQVTSNSNAPVFVETGLASIYPRDMVSWQGFDGHRWERIQEFRILDNGKKVPVSYTIGFYSKPQDVSKTVPIIVESTIRRCEVEDSISLRCSITYYPREQLQHDGIEVSSDEFSLDK